MPGDVVRVNESLVNASLGLLTDTAPVVGIYSVYSLCRIVNNEYSSFIHTCRIVTSVE